jgi:hypothetical protein
LTTKSEGEFQSPSQSYHLLVVCSLLTAGEADYDN